MFVERKIAEMKINRNLAWFEQHVICKHLKSQVYFSIDFDDSLNHSSNSSVVSDIMASIDLENELPVTVNSAKVFLVALWSKFALP